MLDRGAGSERVVTCSAMQRAGRRASLGGGGEILSKVPGERQPERNEQERQRQHQSTSGTGEGSLGSFRRRQRAPGCRHRCVRMGLVVGLWWAWDGLG